MCHSTFGLVNKTRLFKPGCQVGHFESMYKLYAGCLCGSLVTLRQMLTGISPEGISIVESLLPSLYRVYDTVSKIVSYVLVAYRMVIVLHIAVLVSTGGWLFTRSFSETC